MTTKTQLQNKIQELEAELVEFKSQLSSYKEITIENASVGDVLEDGSIVIQKSKGLALLVAPKSTEVNCPWSKKFPEAFEKLEEQGFNPSQWFIPTKEQLQLASQNIPNEFSATDYPNEFSTALYWSSTENNATNAQGFAIGFLYNFGLKTNFLRVRAFRCVTH